MEKITGYVNQVIYYNSENGYTVLALVCEEKEITCVGITYNIRKGDTLELEGTYTEHGTYGRQFKIQSYEYKIPDEEQSIERYLASGVIKGIGVALAARIVNHFKKDTFRIIEEEPERLAEIRGISESKARDIAQQVEENRDTRRVMLFMQQYGISQALAAKIYNTYGSALYTIMQENPYQIVDDISGVGFRTADEIARKMGICADADFRIKGAILYILEQAMQEGHVYLPRRELLGRTAELLDISVQKVEEQLPNLAVERKITCKDLPAANPEENGGEAVVYLMANYHLELDTAKMLYDLNRAAQALDAETLKDSLLESEKQTGLALEERQKMAVLEAGRSGVLVITGGPGTGKTATINALIHCFEAEGMLIFLAAPTGRAAKRITESTGYEAQTIHRLLEVSGILEDGSAGTHFGRNRKNPLEADVVIIDEMSMVDIFLMHALLCAISPGTRLILVGDADQLPSVGPGCVLRDIIESDRFPVARLTKIFRQAGESDIVLNAHRINKGERVPITNKSRDFFFFPRDGFQAITDVVRQLIQKSLPGYIHAEASDIQVLTPGRRGALGVEQLNKTLQGYLNPASARKREKEYAGVIFREGDKVMQIKNNYQAEWEVRGLHGIVADRGTGVFNGDTGIVREINTFAERMTVEFDEKRFVEYPFKQLDELELAYAITIHKSQGSEYPAVIIPLLSGPKVLMTRNLLYTAVTRARKCVAVVGSMQEFCNMIDNHEEQKRYTSLRERICEWDGL